jgi:hypothetical protein
MFVKIDELSIMYWVGIVWGGHSSKLRCALYQREVKNSFVD